MADRIVSALFPPMGIVNLDEEMVSNGSLPAVTVGELMEHMIWHLLGMTVAIPAQWCGGTPDTFGGGEPAKITYALYYSTKVFKKPGARDARVDIIFTGAELPPISSFEVTVTIGSSTKTVVFEGVNTSSSSPDYAYAHHGSITLFGVGAYPGELQNLEEAATLIIRPTSGQDIWLFSASFHWLHTELLIQEE